MCHLHALAVSTLAPELGYLEIVEARLETL